MGKLLPQVARAELFPDRTAIADAAGVHTYRELLDQSRAFAQRLLDGCRDLEESRVAFLVPPGFPYPVVQWGIWQAGGIAVPLGLGHPLPELEYVLQDSGAAVLVADGEREAELHTLARRLNLRFLPASAPLPPPADLPPLGVNRRAQILYTSGTTSRPKGVVTTHRNLQAQMEALIAAWEWAPVDRILHVLPLHHIHGILNVLGCALGSGATCEFLHPFDPVAVWQRFAAGDEELTSPAGRPAPVSLFMAVPTLYSRLIAAWEAAGVEQQQVWSAACRKFRLMVSGSAALPISTLEQWERITGHRLLERYGMTEIGMALSNPLRGARRPGWVGTPLPGYEVRLREEGAEPAPGLPGEIQVRGRGVFSEYWNRAEATREAFQDGWFRTGDVAVREGDWFRILGRSSVDIIKTGGYKVSALEVEEVLREHPAISECAVVGVPDAEWGERVAAVVVLAAGQRLELSELRDWARQRLAIYRVPSLLHCVPKLPKNAMGKVTKPDLRARWNWEGEEGKSNH